MPKMRTLFDVVMMDISTLFISSELVTASLPAAAAMDKPQHDQQQDGAERRGNDRAEETAEVDAERRKQLASDQRADDAETEVGHEAVAGATNDDSGQPTGDQADEENDEKTFCRHGARPASCVDQAVSVVLLTVRCK
jgi:hypothetical protein